MEDEDAKDQSRWDSVREALSKIDKDAFYQRVYGKFIDSEIFVDPRDYQESAEGFYTLNGASYKIVKPMRLACDFTFRQEDLWKACCFDLNHFDAGETLEEAAQNILRSSQTLYLDYLNRHGEKGVFRRSNAVGYGIPSCCASRSFTRYPEQSGPYITPTVQHSWLPRFAHASGRLSALHLRRVSKRENACD